MLEAAYDGFAFTVPDVGFQWHINNGKSEPYGDGQYEFVKNYIRRHPGRNRTYIDVGAHVGTTMLPYSRLYTQVFGYEPNVDNYNLCVSNIQRNKCENCYVSNVAVLDSHVTGKTIKHGDNSGCYYFVQQETGTPSVILDEDERIKDVDFIKIDTEGNELRVLKGALGILKKYKPLLQVETNGLSEKHFGISANDTIGFLTNLGYKRIRNSEFYVADE